MRLCPECEKEDRSHRLYMGGRTTTLMGYEGPYFQDGVYHNHDPNFHKRSWHCSNGHSGVESWQTPCPAGDFPTEREKVY